MAKSKLTAEKPFKVRRGKVDSVDLFEVKENELDILENGEPTGIHLNFSIFLFSLAFSAILTLCSATFKKPIFENIFLFTSIIGLLGGVYLLFLWWNGRKSIKSVIEIIKSRIPPDDSDIEDSDKDVPQINSKKSDDLTLPEG